MQDVEINDCRVDIEFILKTKGKFDVALFLGYPVCLRD